jgi:Ca-activated chloride channel family protein
LADEDFNDDKKDAGELGSGHKVTALYEIIPNGVNDAFTAKVDELKYQSKKNLLTPAPADEWLTIKLRYKKPDEDISRLITRSVTIPPVSEENTSANFQWASAVAEFGMLLRNSAFKESSSLQQVISLARTAKGTDMNGYRSEFVGLVETAATLSLVKK